MKYAFFAMLSRMKNIYRWALMRNTRPENIAEHSHDVAVLVHALALIHNQRFGGTADADACVTAALYHDVPEILTGDLPTPVKYDNPTIRDAYRDLERVAIEKLLSKLPEDLRPAYREALMAERLTEEERMLLKAADKLAALIKCAEELKQGNREFQRAREATEASIRAMHSAAADYFLDELFPAYELTLDEL